jgi:hypothetical protein
MDVLAFIILGVVLIVVIYYFMYNSGSTVLSNKLDLGIVQPPVPVASLGLNPGSPRYSIEMWMYVYNFNGASTYIVSRAAKAATAAIAAVGTLGQPGYQAAVAANPLKNIGIKIDGATPKLTLEYTRPNATTNVSEKQEQLITDNLPLQTWVHLIVSVDNTFVDIYMNGKLVKSFQDKIDAPSDTAPMDYGLVNCYLAKLARTTSATDPQSAWDKYIAGNGENPLAKYLASFGLSVTLQKNNQDYSKVTIF